jgi:hypothetical protein
MHYWCNHMKPPHFAPPCLICGTQVPLEVCMIDEYGQAVHEACYVGKLLLNRHIAPVENQPSQGKTRARRNSAFAATTITVRVRHGSPHMRRRSVNLAAVVTLLLAITGWMAYSHRRLASVAETPNARSLKRQPARTPKVVGPGFTRIRVTPNEVDYIAEDVTIRYFAHESAAQRMPPAYNEVNFGEDVTVHYFAPKLTVGSSIRPVATIAQPTSH